MKNLTQVVKQLNSHLHKKQPKYIDENWVKKNSKASYKFIMENSLDWDSVTVLLDKEFQRKWNKKLKKKDRLCNVFYRDKIEVENLLKPYLPKLYTFVSRISKEDELTCDRISILLVRLAQKGNILALDNLVELFEFIFEKWLEENKAIFRWRGHEAEMYDLLKKCIYRYRYSGTFIGYLYRSLELSGLGLPKLESYSLNDKNPITGKEKIESLII